jgi:hypothetical protein
MLVHNIVYLKAIINPPSLLDMRDIFQFIRLARFVHNLDMVFFCNILKK